MQLPSLPMNALMGYLPILLVFGIFYFLLFMPMQKQKKELALMLENLKAGDTVVTNGGIIGQIQAVHEDNTLTIRVKPDNIKLQIVRSSVASLAGAVAQK